MGNKSGRKRKYITYYITIGCIIAAVSIATCTPVKKKLAEIKAHHQLEQYREKLADGFFETVIEQGKQVVENNETAPPADVALYALGEVYAHHDYTGQDLLLSRYYFEKLKHNFPDSPLTSEAKVYISLFETIAAKEKEATVYKEKALQNEKIVLHQKGKISTSTSRKIVENKNFDEAILKNEQLLKKAGMKKPADQALYNLGLIYAHNDNPEKDYKESQRYFNLLTKQFPDSEYAEEAKIWLGLFETIEKMQQIDVEIEQQRKKLTD